MSTLGPNKLLWKHLKIVLKNKICLRNIIAITNAYIKLDHWLSHFKISLTIVISKPNKASYDSPKSFRPIVLLNTLGKLIEKFISNRLQFHVITNNLIHQSQLGGLKFKSMTDAGITLTYFIHIGWIKNMLISTLTFDISQLFPSLILKKAGFNLHVVYFFPTILSIEEHIMFGTIFPLILLTLISEWVKAWPSLPFYWLFI